MELVVGALVVLAFIAILTRIVFRDASGAVRLPRIVDESVGMWVVRRLLGRPTDPAIDPFARFRRPSTVLGRRPGEPPRTLGPRPRSARVPLAGSAPTITPRAPTAREAGRAAPAVLGDRADPLEPDRLPPAWTTIERSAGPRRAFGASILPAPEPPPRRSRTAAGLLYAVLFVIVAIGGLAVGALAGLASGPNRPSATIAASGGALGSGPPATSPAVSPR